jgi:hypothetical protein
MLRKGPCTSKVMPFAPLATDGPRCELKFRRDPSGPNTGPVTSDPE